MKYCCDGFEELVLTFEWFTRDEGQIYLMPCLVTRGGGRIRVNHCPVCGKEVRSIEIPEEDIQKLITE